MKRFHAPELRKDFVIVAHREKASLAAAAISYLFCPGIYLPMFSFHDVEVALGSEIKHPDVFVIQRTRAEDFSVFLHNALVEYKGELDLILVGLTQEQKSYLTFVNEYNVMEINDVGDLSTYLGGFAVDKGDQIECSEEQAMIGLLHALRANCTLKIGLPNVAIKEYENEQSEGVVIIEDINNAEVVTSINYAFSIGSSVIIVEKLEEGEEVLSLIERWNSGDLVALDLLKEKVHARTENIDFSLYDFITFFTDGLPYSLVISEVPTSYVRIGYSSDFFIHNAILYERNGGSGSAVVFSPSFFEEEETRKLINLLEFKNFYLRKLVAKGANVYNLKTTIECYPFELLHICSHGGDIDGERCVVQFDDDEGRKHEIEFDHIFNVALTPYKDLHSVESIYYFRRLDGFIWKSEELRNQNYSQELYASLLGAISSAFKKKTVIRKGKVNRVANANAVKCSDFSYTANFRQVGSITDHPVIFNNACWSWMNVSTSFLTSGSRGYIGTFREIPNDKAIRFAEVFYDSVFDNNILDAFHSATTDFMKASSNPEYIFWGLHFSTIRNTNVVTSNRLGVLKFLSQGITVWEKKLAAGEGASELVQALISDTQWLLGQVSMGGREGHSPNESITNKKK